MDLRDADAQTGGHAFRVMVAYEHWLAGADEWGARRLAVLRLLGLFDRPASAADIAALRAAPPIPGLTEALFAKPQGWLAAFRRPTRPIADADWSATVTRLEEAGLIAAPGADGSLDAHPLVRQYLAATLKQTSPAAWREGHRRLYERLKASLPHRPEGLNGLQPLYQAVAHGCLAGLYEDACAEVYRDRILRGTGSDGFYSTRKLGAFGAILGAIACLFAEPWGRPAPAMKEGDQAWLLNEAAIQLRALGRLGEALEPMRVSGEMDEKRRDWKGAAISYSNLSELQLTLGRVAEAVADAGRSVDHADRSGDAFQRIGKRTTLADALHQRGETEEAKRRFAEAEAMQAQRQPQYQLLYSLRGFLYCDLLLAGAERAAWGAGPTSSAGACEEVARRARQTLEWVERAGIEQTNLAPPSTTSP